MKTSINKAFISGNLTKGSGASRDPSGFRFSASAWRSTTTAKTTRRVNGRDYTNYLDCVLFGARAASLSRYLAKGYQGEHRGKASMVAMGIQGRRKAKQRSRSSSTRSNSPRPASEKRPRLRRTSQTSGPITICTAMRSSSDSRRGRKTRRDSALRSEFFLLR